MIGLSPTAEALHDGHGVRDGPPEVLGEPLELLVFPEIAKRLQACRNPANQYPYAVF
jgi:hypothetical protein